MPDDAIINLPAPPAARPGAPALEKGLDVLELLAAEAGGLNQKQVAERVGRSVSEIYRMLTVLEQRGYVSRDRRTGEYMLTLHLFRLATQFPPTRRLQQAALPVMEALAAAINLSCHLSVISGSHFMVAATAEPDWQMGWTVKLGALFPLSMEYASARVLAAFQLPGRREEFAAAIAAHDGAATADILAALLRIAANDGEFDASEGPNGVSSLSCPILDAGGRVVAALTVPVLRAAGKAVDLSGVQTKLRDAARRISATIGGEIEPG